MLRYVACVAAATLFPLACFAQASLPPLYQPPYPSGFVDAAIIKLPGGNYPDIARKKNQTGYVCLLATISDDGHVTSATIARSSGHDLLDAAAVQFELGTLYRPATVNGTPTAIRKIEVVSYNLGSNALPLDSPPCPQTSPAQP